MEIETIVGDLISDFYYEGGCATSIHIDDFKKIAIARGLRKKGYRLDCWTWSSDTDHYEVEIDVIKAKDIRGAE
jgi:hypothetical protein